MTQLLAALLTVFLLLGLPILGLRGRSRLAAVDRETTKAEWTVRAPVRRPVLAAPPVEAGLRWTATGVDQWDSGPYRVLMCWPGDTPGVGSGSWVLYGRADKALVILGRFRKLDEAKAKAQEIADQEPA